MKKVSLQGIHIAFVNRSRKADSSVALSSVMRSSKSPTACTPSLSEDILPFIMLFAFFMTPRLSASDAPVAGATARLSAKTKSAAVTRESKVLSMLSPRIGLNAFSL